MKLMKAGLNVELCGTCLNFRGIKPDDLMEGARQSSMRNLFDIIWRSDVFITLGF
ncbi:MAG: DsrE family protein [bacterium]